MGFTNKTPNLGLPQYLANDKPSYLTDFNNAMLAIDQGYEAAKQAGDSAGTAATSATAAVTAMQNTITSLQQTLMALSEAQQDLQASITAGKIVKTSSPTITPVEPASVAFSTLVYNEYNARLEIGITMNPGTYTPVNNIISLGTISNLPFDHIRLRAMSDIVLNWSSISSPTGSGEILSMAISQNNEIQLLTASTLTVATKFVLDFSLALPINHGNSNSRGGMIENVLYAQ